MEEEEEEDKRKEKEKKKGQRDIDGVRKKKREREKVVRRSANVCVRVVWCVVLLLLCARARAR